VARLPADMRAMLEAASVCGVEFHPGTVAQAMGKDAAWVNDSCEQLARQQHWLNSAAVSAQPDGSLDARYSFRHALYRNVFYQRMGSRSGAQLHKETARALDGQRAAAPAELALHFERGHELPSALRHYAQAAANAMRQFAPTEAARLTEHALTLLPRLPEG